jgi:hypothetical protein
VDQDGRRVLEELIPAEQSLHVPVHGRRPVTETREALMDTCSARVVEADGVGLASGLRCWQVFHESDVYRTRVRRCLARHSPIPTSLQPHTTTSATRLLAAGRLAGDDAADDASG